jgi:hypothetical protein
MKPKKISSLNGTFFFNTGRFAAKATQIIKLRPADFTAPQNFDLIDPRGIYQESTLYAYSVSRDSPYREILIDSTVAPSHYHAFKNLDALLVAFYYPYAYPHRVTDPKFGMIGSEHRLHQIGQYSSHFSVLLSTQDFLYFKKVLKFLSLL